MNRTGLFIALALWLVIGVVFGLYPELDLKLAALFFDPETKTFPLKLNEWAGFARDAAMWVAWAFVLPPLVALVVKMIRPDRPLMVSGRAIVFLLVTIIMSAGILTNPAALSSSLRWANSLATWRLVMMTWGAAAGRSTAWVVSSSHPVPTQWYSG